MIKKIVNELEIPCAAVENISGAFLDSETERTEKIEMFQ